MNRMTILALFPWWRFWVMGEGEGAPSFFLSLNAFVKAGHRVVVVMPRGRDLLARDEAEGLEIVRYRGGPTEVLDDMNLPRWWRILKRQLVYWWFVVVAFFVGLREARRVTPDVVISYGDHPQLAVWLIGKLIGRPTVHRMFGTNLSPALGHPLRLAYQYIEVFAITTPTERLIMVNDGSEGDLVARALGVPDERVRFPRNGMDHSLYDPSTPKRVHREALGLPVDATILYATSRFHPEKHVERIVHALPEVFAAHPHAVAVLLGDGPDDAFLRGEVERLGIGDRVIMPGAIDQAGLRRYINAGDLFVAMSDRTNAANPLFEAMVAGRPAVVLDRGAVRDVITPGENGWIVDEPRDLAGVLIDAVSDPERLARVAAAARTWAEANIPTWDRRQEMEAEFVEEVVSEWRAR